QHPDPSHLSLLSRYDTPRDLHSFPTRRSSDLPITSTNRILDFGWADYPLKSQLEISNYARTQRSMPRRSIGWHTALTELSQGRVDRKSTRLNSSHVKISYAVFCLKKKTHRPQY